MPAHSQRSGSNRKERVIPVITKITRYNQITPFGNILYTNGLEVREVKHIDCSSPSKVKASTTMDWQGPRHWRGKAPYGVAPTTAKSFRNWTNLKKKMPQIVYANSIDGADGLWAPDAPMECHWDADKGVWFFPDGDFDTPCLGLVRCDGIYIFTSEREAEVSAWMLGVRAASRVIKSFCDSKKKWAGPLHAHQ